MSEQPLFASEDRDVPLSLHVEPTGMCNLRCEHCRGRAFPQTALTAARFRRILDSLLDLAIPEQVHICGTGEPLLNPHTVEMIEYARAVCPVASLKLTTNLSLSIDRVIGRLVDALDVISVSIDGASESTYAAVRRNGSFRRVCANVRYLAARRRDRRSSLALNINFTPSVTNLPEIAMMPDLCAALGADSLLVWRISDITDPVYECVEEWTTAVRGAVQAGRAAGIPVRVAPIPGRHDRLPSGQPAFCRAPMEWLNVTASGRVAPCCEIWEQPDLERMGLPVLPDCTVAEAWRSQVLVALRAALRRGDGLGPCRQCHWFHAPLLAVGDPLLRGNSHALEGSYGVSRGRRGE